MGPCSPSPHSRRSGSPSGATRERRPPAAAVGLWSALAIAASHLAPHWSAFSDPYSELTVDALSWIAVFAEIGSALALGLVGLGFIRRLRTA